MAENVIEGDSAPTELPKTIVSEELLNEEKRKAKYSKTKEFKEIVEYWTARKKFFQEYLPVGMEVRFQVPSKEIAQQWVLANNIINEINAFLLQYENATEVVKEAERVQRQGT